MENAEVTFSTFGISQEVIFRPFEPKEFDSNICKDSEIVTVLSTGGRQACCGSDTLCPVQITPEFRMSNKER